MWNKNITGKIFDFKKFSLHDGGGIRTTVFLKGCPLKCAWCHNPEGVLMNRLLAYYKNKCIFCGECAKLDRYKQNGYVSMEKNNLVFDRHSCKDWSGYIEVCPTGALSYDCEEYTVEQVLAVVLQDKPFYHYGGGVTVSGGEVFSQYAFTKSLLQACKQKEIHTAIETSLYTEQSNLIGLLPLLDTVYVDFKVFDDAKHLQFTGVSNKRIKENLEFLLSHTSPAVIVRTPLIPQYTADFSNIQSIARYISWISPEVKYELLNYNPLAASKYDLYGIPFGLKGNPKKLSSEQMENYYRIAKEGGVKNLIGLH